jgi:hypothetical protein
LTLSANESASPRQTAASASRVAAVWRGLRLTLGGENFFFGAVNQMHVSQTVYLNRKTLIVLTLLTLMVAGIRFSDGSLLLAIASGAGIDSSSFNASHTQYVFDSPLKILLLKLSPSNILWIAFTFFLISLLPLIGIFTHEKSKWYYLTAALIALTPSIKISLQNIGVGDGLVYLLILVAVGSLNGPVILLTILLIALWHPQQAFFIVGTYCLFSLNYESQFDFRQRLIWSMAGLLIGGARPCS